MYRVLLEVLYLYKVVKNKKIKR